MGLPGWTLTLRAVVGRICGRGLACGHRGLVVQDIQDYPRELRTEGHQGGDMS